MVEVINVGNGCMPALQDLGFEPTDELAMELDMT